ncbi:MAG: hypothetical protein HY719_03840 [Planctomycetes bacterium]|nr:hypothetical protein [Planctomycetota bacterium]
MRIAFRADAFIAIGTGDLLSCVALARTAVALSHEVHFLTRSHEAARRILASSGLPHEFLPEDAPLDREFTWIPARCRAWRADALVMEITERLHDTYDPMPRCAPVMAAIDIMRVTTTPRFDLLVNWEPHAGRLYDPARYPRTRFILDPPNVILPPAMDFDLAARRAFPARAERVLIAMGGGDPMNTTGRLVEFLSAVPGPLQVRAVAGFANPNLEAIRRAAGGSPHRVEVLPSQPGLFDLMTWCDLAFGAGGLTSSELVASGTPAVLISNYFHQEPRCRYFAEHGAAVYWGSDEQWRANARPEDLAALLGDPVRRRSLAEAGRRLLGGGGNRRIVEAIETLWRAGPGLSEPPAPAGGRGEEQA